jgi:hypothetical protein
MPALTVVIPQPPSLSIPSEAVRRASQTNSIRQDSQFVISDAPMTPPLSPGHSEEDLDAIIVDAEPRYSSQEHNVHAAKAPGARSETAAMEVDGHTTSPAVLQPPPRLLEDEHVHLQRSGLKLSDFDVRGTLGMSRLSMTYLDIRIFFFRNWDFWTSLARASSSICSPNWHPKSFCDESSSQD